MTWTLTIGIDKLILTDQEKDFYIQAVKSGEKHVQIKRGMYVDCNYKSLIENTSTNPILNSPNYIELENLKNQSGDAVTRRKMQLEHAINVQFPYEHFADEWEEARRAKSTEITI